MGIEGSWGEGFGDDARLKSEDCGGECWWW